MSIIYVNVQNVDAGAHVEPPDGSSNWFEFWKEKNDFYDPCSCSNRACGAEGVLFGAHVQIVSDPQKRYIIPLCASCILLADEFEVAEYKLTPAKG